MEGSEYPQYKKIIHVWHDMLITLIWLLHSIYMFWNATLYPTNIYT